MKYLIQTLSYKDKCKMQEQCNRRPKAEGLTFKEYKDVPIKKIIQKIGNKLQNQARRKGLNWDKVTDFENRIKEGQPLRGQANTKKIKTYFKSNWFSG